MAERTKNKPELLEHRLPDLSPNCRRLTPGPSYLEALAQPNEDFIRTPISEFRTDGIVTRTGWYARSRQSSAAPGRTQICFHLSPSPCLELVPSKTRGHPTPTRIRESQRLSFRTSSSSKVLTAPAIAAQCQTRSRRKRPTSRSSCVRTHRSALRHSPLREQRPTILYLTATLSSPGRSGRKDVGRGRMVVDRELESIDTGPAAPRI